MADENVFLLYALFMGIFITFVYDLLRIARRVFPHGGFLVSLEDLCFWIYCAVEVFLVMYRFSDGMLRWFAVLGAVAGMCLYKKLASPFFVKYTSMILCKVKELLRKLLGFLLKPFRFLLKKLQNMVLRLLRRLAGRLVRHRAEKEKRKEQRKRYLKKRLTFLLKVLKMTI